VFLAAVVLIVIWGALGPRYRYSDTWQLVINTMTTIITFIMVFIVQNTQNRDARAIQLKLDELIRAVQGARTGMVRLEELSDEDLRSLDRRFREDPRTIRQAKAEWRRPRPSEPGADKSAVFGLITSDEPPSSARGARHPTVGVTHVASNRRPATSHSALHRHLAFRAAMLFRSGSRKTHHLAIAARLSQRLPRRSLRRMPRGALPRGARRARGRALLSCRIRRRPPAALVVPSTYRVSWRS
jgi:low affinity Fe/Cu permease